jgi:hypothetical protein
MNAWEHLPYAPLKPDSVRDGIAASTRSVRAQGDPTEAQVHASTLPLKAAYNLAAMRHAMYPNDSARNN